MRIIRRQTDDSEQVEVVLAGASAALTWGADKGAGSPGESSKESGRDIIERLVFDSPDQFILAQVRGASYYTVGRNVRPEDAGDGYTGPLWNVIRVNDPEQDQQKRPRSPWRLYYINASTGLIDRIVSEIDGERTVAEISSWTEAKGEKIPAEIIWTQQGQVVMRYRVSNFSHE